MNCVAFSPNDRHLVCGSNDGVARVYERDTCKELLVLTGHAGKITAVCYVGQSVICTASADKTLGVWDAATGHR